MKELTTEEKLEVFYNHSIEIAQREAERLVTDHQAALDQLFSEHQTSKQRQKAAELEAETAKLKRDNNKALSAQQLQIKRTLSLKHLEYKDKLFAEAQEKLMAFKESPDYVDYLCRKIQAAIDFAPKDSIEFFLDASDAGLRDEVSAKTGVEVQIDRESFLGGLRAVIPERHILIDHSFASMLQEERDSFIFEEGHVYE